MMFVSGGSVSSSKVSSSILSTIRTLRNNKLKNRISSGRISSGYPSSVLLISSRSFATAFTPRPEGPEHDQHGRKLEDWERDKRWNIHTEFEGGRQPMKEFKMGAYAHKMEKDKDGKLYPQPTYLVHPKKDPAGWTMNIIIIGITVYTASTLSWSEGYFQRRQKVIRERIRKEYDLPVGWDDDIEEDEFYEDA